ncbi:nucleoside monophosphate kinase [Candidatus Microgenomates bacterium]|nr:nucleoside monophosphate kinase [Candidatus Microgenomates bacterium]
MKKNKLPVLDLSTLEDRQKYFLAKAGKEIATLQKYFSKNNLVINMVGKKGSGKGTYTKMFLEALEIEAHHLSIGDLIRTSRLDHTIQKLLPTDTILDLIKRELNTHRDKTVFVDGFPRSIEQVAHAAKFTDFFVVIDVPEVVMDQRMKGRTICPVCQTPRDPKLLLTKYLEYESGEFYLRCDNPPCAKARLVPKEGDKLGIEAIRERLDADQKVMDHLNTLEVKKINLSASVPIRQKDYYADYEIHDIYDLEWDGKKVTPKAKKWVFKDDNGVGSYTLFPPVVVVRMVKEMMKLV